MISSEEYMDIISLHRQGHSIRWISRKLGLHRTTVKRHIESNTFPEYRSEKRKESILEPYKQIIKDYLTEDSYQATWLHERLIKM